MESKFIFFLTIVSICNCLLSARDYPSRFVRSPSQNQKKTPDRRCYYHTNPCQNGTSCETVKTCNHRTVCYSLYDDKTSQVLRRGCWYQDGQDGNNCSSAKCNLRPIGSSVLSFCCCNTDLCNNSTSPPIKGKRARKYRN